MIFLEHTSNQLELKIQKLQKSVPEKTKPKEKHTLISDEYLDKHIEKIIDRDNSKKVKAQVAIKRKSFLARLFSR